MEYFAQADVYIHAHPYLLDFLSLGLTHWKLGVKLIFKIKTLRAIVVGNPTQAHAWIADLKAEVDADIDEDVQESAAHAPQAAVAVK